MRKGIKSAYLAVSLYSCITGQMLRRKDPVHVGSPEPFWRTHLILHRSTSCLV